MLTGKRVLLTKSLKISAAFLAVLLLLFVLFPTGYSSFYARVGLGSNNNPDGDSQNTTFQNDQSIDLTADSGPARVAKEPKPITTSNDTSTGKITNVTLGDFGSGASKIYPVKVPKGFFAYGFIWNKGSFAFSWDGKNFQAPVLLVDKKDGSVASASDLYYGQPDSDTIYIRTADIFGLKISLIKPTETDPGFTVTAGAPYYKGATYTQMGVISRQQWGADESKALWLPSYGSITKITVHHTAGSNTPTDYLAVVRSIYNYHAVSLDWADIGYNYLIDPNGWIYEGRQGGDGATGAHSYLNNYGNVGIAMIGTFSSVLPAAPALESLTRLVAERAALNDIGDIVWGSNFFGHRDFNSTACPGDTLYGYLPGLVPAINTRLQTLTGISDQVQASEDAFLEANRDIPGDASLSNLLLTFDRPTGVTQSEILALIPPYSSIESIGVFQNRAFLRVRDYYSGSEKQLYRSKFLHTVFSFDPDVTDIQITGEYLTQ